MFAFESPYLRFNRRICAHLKVPVCSKINTTEALLAQKYISHWDLPRKVSGWRVEQTIISLDIVIVDR